MRKRIVLGVVIIIAILMVGMLVSGRVLASGAARVNQSDLMAVTPGTLTLQESLDGLNWDPIIGNLTFGYSMVLDPVNLYEYIDIETLEATPPLQDGYYAFFFDAFRAPDGFYAYWADKNVTETASDGTWQAVMWDIINGEAPMFYLEAASGSYSLIDGFQKQFESVDAPLRVNGDYPLGTYHFGGWVTDTDEGMEYLNIQITFTKEATVSITPESSTIGGCGTVDVVIRLEDVHDLYAVDIELAFDATVLEVVDLDAGATGINLSPIDTWFVAADWVINEADNTNGTIRYVATQRRPTDPVDGAGDIARIRFRAKAVGSGDITITKTELSDRDGYLVGRPVNFSDPAATISTDFSAAAVALDIIRLNSSTVQLSWPAQTLDADVEYNLYRSPLPYFNVWDTGVTEMDDTAFDLTGDPITFDDAVLGDLVNNYFYALQVECGNGFMSPVSDQVGKFEYELFETPTTDLSIVGLVLENPDLVDSNDLGNHVEQNIYDDINVDVISISIWNPSAQSFSSYGYPSGSPLALQVKQAYRLAIDIEGDFSPYGSVIWAQVGKLPEISQGDYSFFETPTSDNMWILQPLELSTITNPTQLASQIETDTTNNVDVLAISAWNGIAQNWQTGSSISTRFGYPYRITVDIVGTTPVLWP